MPWVGLAMTQQCRQCSEKRPATEVEVINAGTHNSKKQNQWNKEEKPGFSDLYKEERKQRHLL